MSRQGYVSVYIKELPMTVLGWVVLWVGFMSSLLCILIFLYQTQLFYNK